MSAVRVLVGFFFFRARPTTEIYTLSLHDALPISAFYRRTSSVDSLVKMPPLARNLVDTNALDRKSTRLNSSHANISYAVFCLKKKTSARGSAAASARSTPQARLTAVGRVALSRSA